MTPAVSVVGRAPDLILSLPAESIQSVERVVSVQSCAKVSAIPEPKLAFATNPNSEG